MIIVLQTLYFFRESLFSALEWIFRPYLKKFALLSFKRNVVQENEDFDDQVFSDYDDQKGVVFYPPMYVQRYAAVTDCLMNEVWSGKLEKVVDLGYHDISFIKYLKDIPGIKTILGVDLESIPLRCSSGILECDTNNPTRETLLRIVLCEGNAADPDYRLIGCDAVIAIEMIEHMLPHDLERLVHTVFGFIKPQVAIFTTPNADFNVLFKKLEPNGLRRLDHFFEWTREQFHDWCSNIVLRYPQYTVTCKGVGPGPPDTTQYGCCSQLAMFVAKEYHKQLDLNIGDFVCMPSPPEINCLDHILFPFDSAHEMGDISCVPSPSKLNCTNMQVKKFSQKTRKLMSMNKIDTLMHTKDVVNEIIHLSKMLNVNGQCNTEDGGSWKNINWAENAPYWNQYYKIVKEWEYPFQIKSEEHCILDLVTEEIHRIIDMRDENNARLSVEFGTFKIPIEHLMKIVEHITNDVDKVKDVLEWNGFEVVDNFVIYSRNVFEDETYVPQEVIWPDNSSQSNVNM